MDPRIEEARELVSSLKTKCQLRKEKMMRQQKNNNDEDFENNNNYGSNDVEVDHRSSTGRLSSNSASGSNESAFSSASSEGDDESETNGEEQSISSASSSGRSSANRSVDSTNDLGNSAFNQLITVSNIVPTKQLARDLVEQVRQRFIDSLQSESNKDKYEQSDLIELQNGLVEDPAGHQEQALAFRMISRFINFKEAMELANKQQNDALDKALDESTEKLKELLQFRRHYQLSHVLDEHFCKEMHMLHGIFPFGYDKNHLPVLYLRARVHRRWSHELDESFRRYVAWQINLLTKSYQGAVVKQTIGRNSTDKDGSFGICFDCLSVSYSCVDMDFLSYLVKLLVNYYPTYCRYALCVDLPWLFRSVWKMVRSWLPEDARNTVHLITSKQLTDFIDEDQIPNSIKVNNLPASEKPASLKHRKPNNFDSLKSIDQFAKDLKLSSSEVKQFKAHVDKVCKEYEQLGAI